MPQSGTFLLTQRQNQLRACRARRLDSTICSLREIWETGAYSLGELGVALEVTTSQDFSAAFKLLLLLLRRWEKQKHKIDDS
jgi:hypothetical protein